MKNQATLPPNQEQIMKILNESNSFIEPNIRKAKFIFPSGKTYTLDFDQNIQMMELKYMIQKAAHLRKNSFILTSEGSNYTQYNEETFDSLFPDKQLVVFTLELLNPEEMPDETELLLQINVSCPDHNDKFLLFYCFDCNKSICSKCFTDGTHKGHKIQDKCFYLLPSKYLADKMLENWSQKPYEDFQISVNLNEYKARLNNKIFSELFLLLKQVQSKCNALIDKYNTINESSLNNIRESVRDIKLYCIRALDEYKNAINIKDIINNEEMFIEFDNTFKELAIQQKEKFKENLQKFQDLNKSISLLVQNLIDKICKNIKDNLLQALNQKEYDNIENKINMKLIRPLDKEKILNQISDKKNKMKNKKYERRSVSNFNSFRNNNAFDNININETAKGRNTISIENQTSINNTYNNNSYDKNNNNEDNMMDLVSDSYDSNVNNNNDNLASNGRSNKVNLFNNNINNNLNVNMSMNSTNTNNRNNIFPNINITSTQTLSSNINNNIPKSKIINDNSGSSTVNIEIPKTTYNKSIFTNFLNTGKNNNNNNNQNVFNSVLNSQNENQDKGTSLNNDSNNNNIFFNSSNKKVANTLNINSVSEISPILENRTDIQGNFNQSNNSSFNHDINNLNAATIINKERSEISNPFSIENMVKNNSKKKNNTFDIMNTYKNNTLKINTHPNQVSSNLSLQSPFLQNKNKTSTITATNINITNNEGVNINDINNINKINQTQIQTQTDSLINQNNKLDLVSAIANKLKEAKNELENSQYNNNLARNNFNTIKEESIESDSELKHKINKNIEIKNIDLQFYLNKPFILCPIPGTNKLKIITDDENDETFISITFPEEIG